MATSCDGVAKDLDAHVDKLYGARLEHVRENIPEPAALVGDYN